MNIYIYMYMYCIVLYIIITSIMIWDYKSPFDSIGRPTMKREYYGGHPAQYSKDLYIIIPQLCQ